ncbi:MAG: peptidylprolyl isomerase [Candidatus Sumerlaeaceae bacterium]|nr:peptidylprolyl isomerase [Candidatus Sumerlaeaceae bacterium]
MKSALRFALALAALTGVFPAMANGPYATFKTSEGEFIVELLPEKAPKTVENFIGLAKGTKVWQHPGTKQQMENKPLYNGTVFHRTIKGFMIQGGDPLGTGTGNPGYRFEDEFSDLKFDAPGILAMANSGPNTNGCQFFVTVAPTPHLNNRHTIFGKVVKGMDVVLKIADKPSEPGSGRAINPVKLETVTISDSMPGSAPVKADSPTTGAR